MSLVCSNIHNLSLENHCSRISLRGASLSTISSVALILRNNSSGYLPFSSFLTKACNMFTISGLLVFIGILLVFVWCYLRFKYRKMIKVASTIYPMYKPLPIIGNLNRFIGSNVEALTLNSLREYTKLIAQGIYTFSLWLGPVPFVTTADPAHMHKVLTKTLDKSDEYELFHFALGHGLIGAPGSEWKIKRRFMNPMFHHHNVDKLIPLFNRNSREMVKELFVHSNGKSFNIRPYVLQMAIWSISHVIFGPDFQFERKTEEIHLIESAMDKGTDIWMELLSYVWLRFKPIFDYKYKKDLNKIDDILNKLAQYFRRINDGIDIKNDSLEKEESNHLYKNGKSLYTYGDALRAQSKQFPQLNTEYNLKCEIFNLYFGGSDTVSVAISSCFLALAYHQNMQNELYEELVSVLGDRDEVSLEDLQKMMYLEQVYQESLRWSMVVPAVIRKTTTDLDLGGGITIPAGNSIFVGIAGINLDPKIYPNPTKFNPEHFTAERRAARDPKHFMPFSAGPRNCIGKRYADMLVKIVIVHTVLNYELSTEMDIYSGRKIITAVLLNADGYFVSLSKRKTI